MKEGVHWVGALDWTLRDFHGYTTERGSSYNAYLIIDEKITLIDSVKHYCIDEMLDRIKSVIDPSKIDYLVCNHVEMDHSGALPKLKELAPNAEIICSPNGEKNLTAHYKQNWKFKVVKSGDSVSIGRRSLKFVLTPMVHWPDNMVTYCPEDKILYSNDAFGQHLSSSQRFDDEFALDIIIEEAKKYYANIVLPYGNQVKKALEDLSGIDIGIIAPSHGIIWRSSISVILDQYKKWSANQTEKEAVIAFDSMWGSTEKIAGAVARAFEEKGYIYKLYDLKSSHISDIITDVLTAKYICVGSPTLNSSLLPTVAGFLAYLKGLAPKNRHALAFGSYGWGGQSIIAVETWLHDCGFVMLPNISVKFIPDHEQLLAITKNLVKQID
ncbi:MAG: FprA family A-type flavoprotein [Fibrobacteres bacterium]|nr:FprA family A-type flavoprotein [Fibrobacterota bacterium]